MLRCPSRRTRVPSQMHDAADALPPPPRSPKRMAGALANDEMDNGEHYKYANDATPTARMEDEQPPDDDVDDQGSEVACDADHGKVNQTSHARTRTPRPTSCTDKRDMSEDEDAVVSEEEYSATKDDKGRWHLTAQDGGGSMRLLNSSGEGAHGILGLRGVFFPHEM